MREPKDIHKYISPKVAAARLMYIALENIMFLREGVRVKWELKLRFFYPSDVLKKMKSPAVAMGGTFTSGPEVEGIDD